MKPADVLVRPVITEKVNNQIEKSGFLGSDYN